MRLAANFARAGASLALALFATAAHARAHEVPFLQRGETVKGEVSAGAPDVYRIVGFPGETLQAQIAGAGEVSLIFYTADGKFITGQVSTDAAKLELVISAPGSIYLVVTKPAGAGRYSLSLSGRDPSFAASIFASGVGYTSGEGKWEVVKCWISPGSVFRETYKSGFVRTFTMGRDDVVHLTTNGGPDGALRYFTMDYVLEGNDVKMTSLETGHPPTDAQVQTVSLRGPPKDGSPLSRNWSGYLCD